MTDERIIKALENITNEKIGCCAEDCAFYDGKVHGCVQTVAKHSLDLINRQKAEILLFRKENTTLALDNSLKEKKIEELSEVLSDTIRIRYAEAKAEAVKEFAELIKRNHGALFNIIYSKRFGEIIDNLVKEMVGEG